MAQLTALMEKISAAAADITKMQAQLPALIAAVSAEASAPAGGKVKLAFTKIAKAEVAQDKAEGKPKKPASDGTMAWHAFVSHVQEQQPSRFAEMKKHSEILHEAKAIREEDEAAYKAFIASWKAERLASAPEGGAAAEEVVVIKEKKKVAVGTMAWHAFVAHCKTIMPELEGMANAEKLQLIKARKESDAAGYESFVAEWKAVQA
jgi:hypothetical protein